MNCEHCFHELKLRTNVHRFCCTQCRSNNWYQCNIKGCTLTEKEKKMKDRNHKSKGIRDKKRVETAAMSEDKKRLS